MGAEDLAKYRNGLTPEQQKEHTRKATEARRKAFAAAQANRVRTRAIPERAIQLSLQERVKGRYLPGSSRTVTLLNPPFTADEIHAWLERQVNDLRANGLRNTTQTTKHVAW